MPPSTGSAITALDNTASDTQANPSFTWSAPGLPNGLSIDATTGTITGTPTTAGTYTVTITATDGLGAMGAASFNWAITANTVTVADPGNQSDVSGTAITALANSATDTEAGATFTWSATGLPGGLSILATSGTITGTATTVGSYPTVVIATDNLGVSGSANFTWAITGTGATGTVGVTNPGNQSSLAGTPITALGNSATGSSPTATIVSWSARGLPAGLSIDTATGTVTGAPTTPGTYSVTLSATDSSGATGATVFTWVVTSPSTVTLANPGPESDVVGTAITPLSVVATDTEPGPSYTWSASVLPEGLSIAPATGIISGTPTTAEAPSVAVTATDNLGSSGSVTFTWTITSPAPAPIGFPVTPTTTVPPAVPPTPTVAPTTTVTPTVTVPLPAGTPAGTYAAPVTALVGAQRVELNSTANGAAVSVSVPAGALPAGTEVALAAVAHPAALIVQVPAGQSYVVSLAHKGGKKAYRQDSATFLSRRSAGSGQRQLAVTSAGGGAPAQGPSARSGAEVPPGLSPAQT